jgi:hypothetical protein
MSEVDKERQVNDTTARLNRRLSAVSQCNRLLWLARDERAMLQSICQILVDRAGLRLVWIGYCEDDAKKTVRPVAGAGDDLGYLERLKISWGNSDAGDGPVGEAIRTEQSSTQQNYKKNYQCVFVGVINVLELRVETPEEVRDRILEAAEYIPCISRNSI